MVKDKELHSGNTVPLWFALWIKVAGIRVCVWDKGVLRVVVHMDLQVQVVAINSVGNRLVSPPQSNLLKKYKGYLQRERNWKDAVTSSNLPVTVRLQF